MALAEEIKIDSDFVGLQEWQQEVNELFKQMISRTIFHAQYLYGSETDLEFGESLIARTRAVKIAYYSIIP